MAQCEYNLVDRNTLDEIIHCLSILSFLLHCYRPWLIVAEMFEAKYVATAMSASCQLNWACNFIVGLVFPYLQSYLGAFSFVPFAVVLLFTIIFVIVWLPETKGTTPEELRDDIVRSLSHLMLFSDDGSNPNNSSSVGNPIDIEWRRAMDDLKQQEEEDMKRGTYSKFSVCSLLASSVVLSLLSLTAQFCTQIMDFSR